MSDVFGTEIAVEVAAGDISLRFATGQLAKQADGAVLVSSADTVVLSTVVGAQEARPGADFFPLTVDVEEKMYAAGKIPGGFFKREGKPPEKEVLTSRLIDRPIRPLFPNGWRYETQIIAMVMSADTENDSDVLAITGASAALAISSIPFEKTIAGVRIGLVEGNTAIGAGIGPVLEARDVMAVLDRDPAAPADGDVGAGFGCPRANIFAWVWTNGQAWQVTFSHVNRVQDDASVKRQQTIGRSN